MPEIRGEVTALLDRFRAENPEYWASLGDNQRSKIQELARQAVTGGWQYERFFRQVKALQSYTNFVPAPATEEPVPEEPLPEPVPGIPVNTGDMRALIKQTLDLWGLSNLSGFVEKAITEGWGYEETLVNLRESPEYKAAFPEVALRRERGLAHMSELEILQARGEIRRLTREYAGVDPTSQEISSVIASNKSVAEWERTLIDYQQFKRWGPVVKGVLEQELGHALTDDRVFAFVSAYIPTPELDLAYENALLRGRPAALGLGVRPEQEAELLRQFGIDPNEAFRGYEGIVSELPRANRLAMIESYIESNGTMFPDLSTTLGDTTFGTLFRAIQLGDPEAIARLQAQMAREVARFQGGGAPATAGTAAVGLLSPEQRRTLAQR